MARPTSPRRLDRLRDLLGELDSALVAFSGGVDSTFLLRVAHDVLGARCLALTTASSDHTGRRPRGGARARPRRSASRTSSSTPTSCRSRATPRTPSNRCWFCKDNLFDICAAEAARARARRSCSTAPTSTTSRDHRPGLAAAAAHAVRHPLVEAGFTKADIRAPAARSGCPTWDRPASPCLSSRFPYGTRITAERLERVAAAERWLRELGLRELRVRFHDAARAHRGAGRTTCRACSPCAPRPWSRPSGGSASPGSRSTCRASAAAA